MIAKIKKYSFLFSELVKRDFKKKYKRTVLGMLWSMLSPLMTLLVMSIVFTQFFGRSTPHYTIYMFCGTLLYNYFKEATSGGMTALVSNASILTKVNIPKYLFVFSKNVSALINFLLCLVLLFIFAAADHIAFTWRFFLLIYPIVCLLVFNVGTGLILSAMYVFFKDVQYLYDIFTLLLMYVSAIFYTIDSYAPAFQKLFYLNPIFVYITYFRTIIIDGTVPSLALHGLAVFYAALVLIIGCVIYKKQNYKFIYYM